MSPKRIWLFLFFGVSALSLHFTFRLWGDGSHYFFLKNEAKARVSKWEIVQVKDKFALKANYGFEAQEKNWQGVFTLTPPYYLNEYSALASLKEKAKESWTAWYNPRNPESSVLEKSFPAGLLFRTLICYSVLIYFLYLYKRFVPV